MYMNNTNFTYQMSNLNSIQSGPVLWSLQPSIDNLSINVNTGVLTFINNNIIVNCNIIVSASNINKYTGSASFNLSVVQAPYIIPPTNNVLSASMLPDNIYSYTLEQCNLNTGSLIWNITDMQSNAVNGVYLNNTSSQYATINIIPNIYINQNLILSASNIYGTSVAYSLKKVPLDLLLWVLGRIRFV